MARTLNDAVIVAMIEAATRLAAGRGPVSGSAPSHGLPAALSQGGPSGEGTGAQVVTDQPKHEAPSQGAGTSSDREHDTRSADQIGHDFQAIYRSIDDVVRSSAEQETKAVGFGMR